MIYCMDFSQINQIQILPFDTSCRKDKYLLYHRNQYYEVNAMLAEFVGALQRHNSIAGVSSYFSEKYGKSYSDDDITAIINKFIGPIIKAGDDAETKKASKSKTFIFKIGLVPPEAVKSIASKFSFLFRPRFASLLLFLILISEILFFTSDLGIIHSLSGTSAYVIGGVIGLFVLCSLFHETGHAAACRYFGIENGGIGFGLYISFPVFYTDVTNVWQLSRKQRIIVNIGGVYFQLIFLLPIFLIYFLTGNNIAKLFIYTINLNFLFTLNPFFKFDGYWIMSDLVGVPNLRNRSMEYFTYLFKRIRGRENPRKPFLLSIKPAERCFMIVYSLVVNVFFLYFFAYGMPLVVYNFFKVFPDNAARIVGSFTAGTWPGTSLIVSSIFQLVMFGFIALFVYKMVLKLVARIQVRNGR